MSLSYYSICAVFNTESISLDVMSFIVFPCILNTYRLPLLSKDMYIVKLPFAMRELAYVERGVTTSEVLKGIGLR